MSYKIFLSPLHVFGKELECIKEVFESNYIAPVGEFIDRFEKDICDYTKAKYAVAVSSGTAAIHLALRILGVKENDRVLTLTFTLFGLAENKQGVYKKLVAKVECFLYNKGNKRELT